MINQTTTESHPLWEQPIGSLVDKADAGELSHDEAISKLVALCVDLIQDSMLTDLGAAQTYLRKRGASMQIVALPFDQEEQLEHGCIDYETNEARPYYFRVLPAEIVKMSLAGNIMSDEVHEMILRHDTGVLAPVELLEENRSA